MKGKTETSNFTLFSKYRKIKEQKDVSFQAIKNMNIASSIPYNMSMF